MTVVRTPVIGPINLGGGTTPDPPDPTDLFNHFVDSENVWSLRRTRSDYTGSAIRVRNTTINSERDIGFDENEDLDVAEIDQFIQSGQDGVVVTLYNQSGGPDLVQSVPERAPHIAQNGTVVTNSSQMPAIQFGPVDTNPAQTSAVLGNRYLQADVPASGAILESADLTIHMMCSDSRRASYVWNVGGTDVLSVSNGGLISLATKTPAGTTDSQHTSNLSFQVFTGATPFYELAINSLWFSRQSMLENLNQQLIIVIDEVTSATRSSQRIATFSNNVGGTWESFRGWIDYPPQHSDLDAQVLRVGNRFVTGGTPDTEDEGGRPALVYFKLSELVLLDFAQTTAARTRYHDSMVSYWNP